MELMKTGPRQSKVLVSHYRRKASKLSQSIMLQHCQLQNILKNHEAIIRKRWQKKTTNLRRKTLLEVWPDMPPRHRADFGAFRKEADPFLGQITGHRGALINQEDMTKPDTLLLLLSSRARHLPSEFATMDIGSLSVEASSLKSRMEPLWHHTMLLNSITDPKQYGKIVSWEDVPESYDWLLHLDQYPPSLGMHVLELQEHVLRILVDCCKKIMHDVPESSLLSSISDKTLMPQFRPQTDATKYTSLAQMTAEAAYRPPLIADFKRVVAILRSTASAQEDHLWLLREDPGYFHDFLLVRRSHRLELLPDIDGKGDPYWTSDGEYLLWERIVMEMVFEVRDDFELICQLLCYAEEVVKMQNKYGTEVSVNSELPKEYSVAFAGFKKGLALAFDSQIKHLKSEMPASPPLKHLFYRQTTSKNSPYDIVIAHLRKDVQLDKTTEHLYWLFRNIAISEDSFYTSMPVMIDELERLLQSDAQAKSLISNNIAATIGTLSILKVCQEQVSDQENCRSRVKTKEIKEITTEMMEAHSRSMKYRADVARRDGPDGHLDKVLDCLIPFIGRFEYPTEKRRTKENVAVLRKAEADLDAFWSAVDNTWSFWVAEKEFWGIQRTSFGPRSLRRTPEWIEPGPTAVSNNSKPITQSALVQPLSEVDFEREYRTTATLTPSHDNKPPKIKVKTRATHDQLPAKQTADNNAPARDQNNPNSKGFIAVTPRAFKVFRTLFFNPDVTSTPGEVPWNDFVAALISIGFKAEKLYGSVWQFEPTFLEASGQDVNEREIDASVNNTTTTAKYRNIQFHEPHPSGKIPFFVARRHGRRLHRAYGWTLETFKLKEKNKNENSNEEK